MADVSRYVLEYLEIRLGFEKNIVVDKRNDIKIEYNKKSFVLPAYFIESEGDQFLKERNSFDFSLKKFRFNGIEFLGMYPRKGESKSATKYDIDIIGTIFVMLSRYEEQILPKQNFDYYNRFKPENAINFKYLDTPVVDELVSLFKRLLLRKLDLNLKQKGEAFKISPSHDVDRPFEYLYYSKKRLLKRLGGDLLVRRDPKMAVRRLAKYQKVKSGGLDSDPYNTFEWIMDQSEQNNRTSTFHFITQVTDPEKDQDYDLQNTEMKSLFKKIDQRGHQIALHPSFKASEISGQVFREASILREFCEELNIEVEPLKSRYHYLRWNNDSLEELEKADIKIDQTLGYAERPGFRCGTCHPYYAFNFRRMEASSVIIEPLILMEISLFSDAYLGLKNNFEEAWNIVLNLKEQCKNHNGNCTVLWHNNHLIEDEMKDFYKQCIST